MKRLLKYPIRWMAYILCVLAVLCTSCEPEETDAGRQEGKEATIRVEVRSEEQVDIATRAVNESAVNDLHILIYNSSGELIGQKYQAGSTTVTVNTRSATGCTIYAIANTANMNLFKGYNIHKEAYLKSMVKTITDVNALTNGTNLPMTGKKAGVTINAGTNTLSGTLALTRMAAKVTLKIGVKAHSGITITQYMIGNLPLSSYYIARPLDTEAKTDDTKAGDDAGKSWNGTTVNLAAGTTATTKTFYMFENRRGVKTTISKQKDKTQANAPGNATYVTISGKIGTVTATWIVFLGANNTNNFNIKRNCNYTVNITLNDAAVADTRVTVVFTGVEDLSAAGTANCYLAKKTETWYKFKATVRGNGAATASNISPTGVAFAKNANISPASAELVWETNGHEQIIQGLTLKDGYVYFKTGPATDGNAVVAVKDGSGKVLWSWHIWKTAFDLAGIPAQTYKTYPRSGMNGTIYSITVPTRRELVMMDRDLGAASSIASNTNEVVKTFGLYYQFGRKDPFPTAKNRERKKTDNNSEIIDIFDKNGNKLNAAALRETTYQVLNSSISTSSFQAIIAYSIEHPLTFILSNDDTYNWIYGATKQSEAWKASNRLWGGALNNETSSRRLDTKFTGKTIYDPCPLGWCMPPQDTWTNFTTSLLNGDTNSNYNISIANLYNCPAEDKKNYIDGDNSGFVNSTGVFGRRYYLSGASGSTAFYPASGFRYYGNGKVCDVGASSYIWASSPVDYELVQGACLNTNLASVYPVSSNSRGNGFSVRCVKE